MAFLNELPIWQLTILIFLCRIVDVSFGTMRVIAVVHGRTSHAVILGFFEILVWLAAVSQVVLSLQEHPVLMLAYAGGFATGNAVGIWLERKVAMGASIILMISQEKGDLIADRLRDEGQKLTTVEGRGRFGLRTLIYVLSGRRNLRRIIRKARELDPELVYAVDHCSEASYSTQLGQTTLGWRAFVKRK